MSKPSLARDHAPRNSSEDPKKLTPAELRDRLRRVFVCSLKEAERLGLKAAGKHSFGLLAEKVLFCLACFGVYGTEDGCRLVKPRHCMVRLCPHCEARRRARLVPILSQIIRLMKRPKLLTLTVRNTEDLTPESIDELRSYFTRLRHLVEWNKRVTGGLYSIEITNEGKGFHPHIHAVIDCLDYWVEDEISRLWQRCNRGLGMIVDIELVRLGGVDKRGRKWTVERAAWELAKYVVKPGRWYDCPEIVAKIYNAISGKRLIGTFGAYYNKDAELRRAEKEQLGPHVCAHGAEFMYFGVVGLRDVYREGKEWRIFDHSWYRVQSNYVDALLRRFG